LRPPIQGFGFHPKKAHQVRKLRCCSSCARIRPHTDPLQDVDFSTISPAEIAQLLARKTPPADKDHLYLYSIIPASLDMPLGKAGAQLGHGFEYTLTHCEWFDPKSAERYKQQNNAGSKVCMESKNQSQLIKAYGMARELGLPCSLVVDEHHVLPPHFDGEPIVTALGIGPCTKAQAKEITKRFQCL